MPIVNGTYVNDSLPNAKQAQQQVFGDYSRRDMSDYSQAAYNYLMKQQEQAYNLELWNLMNQYNSPAAQMQRYQDAGLNPYLIYGQSNATSSPASASAPSFRSSGTQAKHQQNQINMIGQIQSLVKSAVDTYEYMTHGSETSRWRMIGAQEQALGLKLENAWNDYLLHGDNMIYGDPTRMVNGPKATTYKYQQDQMFQNVEKTKYMISSLLPSQTARQKALKALDEYQLEFMQGKYSAVLDIDLGLGDTVNQWAKMIMFMALAKVF